METAAPVLPGNLTADTDFIEAAQLRNLLHDLALTPSVCIRMRLENQPWPALFSQVLIFTSHAIILAHMTTRTVTYLHDLTGVEEFQLDSDRDTFKAYIPYTLKVQSPQLNRQINGPLHA